MRHRQKTLKTALALSGLVVLVSCGKPAPPQAAPKSELDCMARAMYFESNRSSRDGMVAVGSVVMNRVESDAYPNTVCGVVGQKNQFAPGVMTKEMQLQTAPLITGTARSVYNGERHPRIGNSKFFHAAWYKASYNNMHYVLTAGGNAFYEKRKPQNVTSPSPLPAVEGLTQP
ncbi:spore germination cell wall hydrolase CwlJ-like protein [Sulfitobacter undariae]|uniref:Spore germination cell wall hydrolase CwlJ-like protein n=1 Tax=Sulfitobacter undariae TaxID=1563671 RepID=A0A7W6EDS8_9RHOB|nr:cell wall hydrolase [Sulfitobacter undariae]MBB3995954.1 spore germination cell wall hydrolase CwlJ-like protein [Sulfitobacter undariae]